MTEHTPQTVASGLEGVIAAQTRLSHVEGAAGRLVLCGLRLEDFAARHGFESAASAFWAAATDASPQSPEAVREALGRAREAAYARFLPLIPALEPLSFSAGLRLGLASLPDDEFASPADVTGAVPVFIANIARLKRGAQSMPPRPESGHVEDFLRMLHGEPPEEPVVQALSTYLVTVMDHGMNASTFTARVIASTRAGLTWAAVGAFAALIGPLHGGAPEPVLDMLDAIGKPERAAAWIEKALERGERIMGFGHRIYKVRDPRADVLKGALERLGPAGERLELARTVEAAALAALRRHKPERKLETNVEFYTAMLLDALGMPRQAFTPLFAMGRVVGWTAHALEQQRTGRLIRPASAYVGPAPK
jgi:citrate synthase